MDDTNALSPEEAKYFDTKGEADLAEAPETAEPEVIEPVEKVAEKVEEKPATEIEVVSEEEADTIEPDARKYIKVGVLRKEREKGKTLRLEIQQERQARQALEQRIHEMQHPQRDLEPGEVVQQTAQEVQQLKAELAQRNNKANFVAAYAQKAAEFAKETPDFGAAYKHILDARRTQYEMGGFDEAQVAQLLESEEAAIVERALMNGENPAKKLYDIATKVYGYQPKKAEADPVNEQVKKQADTADKTLEAAKKLEKIAKGMDKNKSLAGGGGGNDSPSLEELSAMDDAAFEKATSGKKFRELMGG